MTDMLPPSDGADVATYLAELATLGGYFTLPTGVAGQSRCLSELFTDDAILDHIGRTRAAIASSTGCASDRIPVRMAASSFQLGVAARLLSPAIGSALCVAAIPVLDHRSVRWQPSEGHAPQFTVTETDWIPVTPATSAQVISESVIPALTDLGARLDRLVSLSPRITLGNLTSAANGAVTVLAMSRPQLEAAGRALVSALLGTEALAGTGSFPDGHFRRNSCCLFYQAPQSGLCGDCVLTPETAR